MSCKDKNPLIREGTSLLTRVLTALSTGYAKVDEREVADIILFGKRYAEYLNYYNTSNITEGNWQQFMEIDASTALAELGAIHIQEFYDYKKLLYKNILIAGTELEAKKQLKFVFDFIFSVAQFADQQYRQIPDNLPNKEILSGTISNKIGSALATIVEMYAVAVNNNLVVQSSQDLDPNAPVPVISSAVFNKTFLSSEWHQKKNEQPPPALISIPPDYSLSIPPGLTTTEEQILYLINHNLFNSQIEKLFGGIAFLVTKAGEAFKQTIDEYPTHSPQYALFLTFVQLFRHAQDDLNKYTQHHLDFYYKDVLQLKNKKARPDSAHLSFELQKPVLQHELKKNTVFKGGKDNTGKEITYALTEDMVLNKAVVSKLHALQITREGRPILFASPVANSGDGHGGKIRSGDKSWSTFGDSKKPAATCGIAIASNTLYLNEGTRKITVKVSFKSAIPDLIEGSHVYNRHCFTARLTGKEGWHPVNVLSVQTDNTGSQLLFDFTLSPDDPALVPYSEKIHKENYNIALPLLQIFLNQEVNDAIPYTFLATLEITSIDISVNVDGVKDLMLSNDTGSIDGAKPFKPYGDFPDKGAFFYIGSKEIFQKNLTKIEFKSDVTIPCENIGQVLSKGSWENPIVQDSGTPNLSFSFAPFPASAVDFSKNEPLGAASIEGFMRLALNESDSSKDAYLAKITSAINSTTVTRTTTTQVQYSFHIDTIPSPTEIKINDFSIDYEASSTVTLKSASTDLNNRFYHLMPFGYYEVYFDSNKPLKKITLCGEISNDGELFIGLDAAEPETVVNFLFQVSDGTSNPLEKMKEVNWYYLAENNWHAFNDHEVIDRTNNFTQSGIVTISLPVSIRKDNTVLEKGLHWIKAAVIDTPDAVCKMILVQTQSARVQLVQDETKLIEFRQTLPPDRITKLQITDPAIKSITQPFDSFGGKPRETDELFYVRVSERLRHKQRAITIWDYEHLVLEEFPQIYKVKCINHAGFYTDPQNKKVFCENYPGHVTVVTIPDLKNKTNTNPLRPYTSIGLLENIKAYLLRLHSPFVKLEVETPQFEEVQLDFKVKFHENLNKSFYKQLLDKEIEKFLCPWAFGEKDELVFGGKIIRSVLLNFVEERPYVDHVTCFKMSHIIEREGDVHVLQKPDVEEAVASTSRSVLVSYYNEKNNTRHIIEPSETCGC
jgi:hypothetical protein